MDSLSASPGAAHSIADLPSWIAEKIRTNPITGCWEWIGAVEQGRYGQLVIFGRNIGAHRAVFELLVGPVPKTLELDHLCRARWCVNPAHLEVVTGKENQRRGNNFYRRAKLNDHHVTVRFIPKTVSSTTSSDAQLLANHVLEALGDDVRAYMTTICDRLSAKWPELYRGMTTQRLSKNLRPLGVKSRQINTRTPDGVQMNRRGLYKVDLVDAIEAGCAS